MTRAAPLNQYQLSDEKHNIKEERTIYTMTNRQLHPAEASVREQVEVIEASDESLSPSEPWSVLTLAARPYLTLFERLPADTEVTLLAWHPEFTSEDIRCCTATGHTETEAAQRQRLEEARYSLILALLQVDLSVPEPVRDTTPYVFTETVPLSKD